MSFLPGWNPGFIAAEAPILVSQVLSATAETTVTLPSGILENDLICIAASGQSSSSDSPNFSDPSGFTLLTSQDGSTDGRAYRCRIFAKRADGTEDGTNITVFTDSDDARTAHCVVFRPNKRFLNFAAVDSDSSLTQFNPAAINVGSGLDYNIALTLFSGANLTSQPDMSSRSSVPTQDGETEQDATAGFEGIVRNITILRWHMWNPEKAAEEVVSDLGDTGVLSAMTSVAIRLT